MKPSNIKPPCQVACSCSPNGQTSYYRWGLPGSKFSEKKNITLWWTNILLRKITMFNGKIHYFYGHFQ